MCNIYKNEGKNGHGSTSVNHIGFSADRGVVGHMVIATLGIGILGFALLAMLLADTV